MTTTRIFWSRRDRAASGPSAIGSNGVGPVLEGIFGKFCRPARAVPL